MEVSTQAREHFWKVVQDPVRYGLDRAERAALKCFLLTCYRDGQMLKAVYDRNSFPLVGYQSDIVDLINLDFSKIYKLLNNPKRWFLPVGSRTNHFAKNTDKNKHEFTRANLNKLANEYYNKHCKGLDNHFSLGFSGNKDLEIICVA
jgi:hypothetical protein